MSYYALKEYLFNLVEQTCSLKPLSPYNDPVLKHAFDEIKNLDAEVPVWSEACETLLDEMDYWFRQVQHHQFKVMAKHTNNHKLIGFKVANLIAKHRETILQETQTYQPWILV